MLCLHHYDLDGHCSAAILKYRYPDIETYEINYGDEIPWEKIKNNVICIVDFSFNLDDMKRALKEAKKVIWIDHHISAIKDLDSIAKEIPGVRDVDEKYSGCELTWKYVFPDLDVPRVVKLLGRYDVHDYLDKIVLPFQYAMRTKETDPKDSMNLWVNLFNDSDGLDFLDYDSLIEEIIEEGKPMAKFIENRNVEFVKNNAVCVHLDGYKFLAINTYVENSNALERLFKPDKWDAMMVFYRRSGGWSVSIYNGDFDTGVDCEKIAQKYGGGGHADAAGFTCKKLPFEV